MRTCQWLSEGNLKKEIERTNASVQDQVITSNVIREVVFIKNIATLRRKFEIDDETISYLLGLPLI